MKKGQYERRKGVLDRLTAQLKSGKKVKKVDGRTTTVKVDLTEGDKNRIKNEISTLEKRIKTAEA